MKLSELHDLLVVRNADDDKLLTFGICDVFAWRGSYDDIAFKVSRDVSVADHNKNIKEAFGQHYSHKGTLHEHDEDSDVFFSNGSSTTSKDMIEDVSAEMAFYVDEKAHQFESMLQSDDYDLSEAFSWMLSESIKKDLDNS